ncbi:Paladin [Durusdinium trenchii]|uniref:Paladin n=1 Tax=Durusdinium trenchii TaxID=1381693 RepID=A0ABP0QVT7_9DINO
MASAAASASGAGPGGNGDSKPVYKMEGWSKFRQTPQIKSCDMVLEMETESRDVIVMALDKYMSSHDYESAASLIKSNMDKKFGGPWHVIIGEGFGFDVVHQARQLIHVHYQNVTFRCEACALVVKLLRHCRCGLNLGCRLGRTLACISTSCAKTVKSMLGCKRSRASFSADVSRSEMDASLWPLSIESVEALVEPQARPKDAEIAAVALQRSFAGRRASAVRALVPAVAGKSGSAETGRRRRRRQGVGLRPSKTLAAGLATARVSGGSSGNGSRAGDVTPQKKDGTITAKELKSAISRSARRPLISSGLLDTPIVGLAVNSVSEALDSRRGSVLDSGSILKTDFVSVVKYSMHDLLPVRINGTFHLRQSRATKIFGVAQPTIPGIRGILNLLGAGRHAMNGRPNEPLPKRQQVLWINLREEPTLYINGRSTVLRERHAPFHNIDQFQGIDASRIEELERRLKEDVVEEAARFGGNVILHEESKRRELETSWESVSLGDIKSPEEVFFTFRMDGYRVQYRRIPTTPEKAPSSYFFDALLNCLMDTSPETTIVFNCQTGGSRSTIAMITSGLIQMWRGIIDIPRRLSSHNSSGSTISEGPPQSPPKEGVVRVLSGIALSSLEKGLRMAEPDDANKSDSDGGLSQVMDDTTKQLEAGWYQPVLDLIRLVDGGREAKKHVDFFCHDAAHLVHMRQIIFIQRNRASRERLAPSEALKMSRAATSLLRYVMLVTFDAYLSMQVSAMMDTSSRRTSSVEVSPDHFEFVDGAVELQDTPANEIHKARGRGFSSKSSHFPMTFTEWLNSRPEVVRLLDHIERDPTAALASHDLDDNEHLSSGLQQEMRLALSARRGSMLNTDTILKADHFPGGMVDRKHFDLSEVHFRGAPNFRNVEGTRVYGVCTPTLDAASEIAVYIQRASGAKKVVWTNLREEPVVYINKQPFVLRSIRQPFRNVDAFISIDANRLEAAERRLKEDILDEARRFNGRTLVHSEAEDRSLTIFWEHIQEDDVLTPLEMYQTLVESGLSIDYARVPLTPERPPSPEDIDLVLERVRAHKDEPGSHFIFNCQMGRGRSTMAMAIAVMELERNVDPGEDFNEYLLQYGKTSDFRFSRSLIKSDDNLHDKPKKKKTIVRKHGLLSREATGGFGSEEDGDSNSDGGFGYPNDRSKTPPAPSYTTMSVASDSSDDELTVNDDAEYGVILSLMRVLSHGIMAKKWTEGVVDKCGAVENVRRNIAENVERASTSRTSQRSAEFVERGLLNLRRYFVLVIVAAYQISVSLDEVQDSFAQWFFCRPELKTIFNGIKGAEALQFASNTVLSAPPPEEGEAALPPKDAAAPGSPSKGTPRPNTPPPVSQKEKDEHDVFAFVARRNGMVLTKGSVLKSDHFPGCNRLKKAKVTIAGAPNFREISCSETNPQMNPDLGIFGVGIPTVEGLKGVLSHVQQGDEEKQIVWINLREEPILYVNGRPFVLRKLEHPFENLEHTGISRERVEDMEARLKVDVINEILNNGGRFLLHDEDESGLQPLWEEVDISEGSSGVQTPRDLYDMLAFQFRVRQFRVPITDEQAPKVTDYDAVSAIVRAAPSDSVIVFNCQMGRGRTTTGLCIATAVRLWARRQLLNFPVVLSSLLHENAAVTKARVRKGPFESEKERRLLNGSYDAINTLTRVLEHGLDAKKTADAVIDICDLMQNLREAIYALKLASEADNLSAVN